jgi:hypothetical protein
MLSAGTSMGIDFPFLLPYMKNLLTMWELMIPNDEVFPTTEDHFL